MYCLRCGRDTKSDRVFCDQCQQNMDLYPVKPGTAIHLPKRNTSVAVKKKTRRKKQLSSEEQITQLKASLKRTRIFVAALLFMLALTITAMLYIATHLEDPNLGKNYTIDSTQQTD